MGLILTLSDGAASVHLGVGQASDQRLQGPRQFRDDDELPSVLFDRADELVVVEARIGAQSYLPHRRRQLLKTGVEQPDYSDRRVDVLAVPLWFARAGSTVGYGYVWQRPRRNQVGLGPLGVKSQTDAVACVGAAFRWLTRQKDVDDDGAQIKQSTYYVAVPGPHPTLAPLLRAGFHIADVETFCCSRSDLFFDPQTYLAPAGPEGTSVF